MHTDTMLTPTVHTHTHRLHTHTHLLYTHPIMHKHTPTVHTLHNHKMKSRLFSLFHPNWPRPALDLPLPLSLMPGKGCEISAKDLTSSPQEEGVRFGAVE